MRLLDTQIAARADTPAAEPILRAALEREQEFGTGIGDGVAIPHVRLERLRNPVLAYAHSAAGIEWDAPDAAPVHHVFFLASSAGTEDVHVQILAAIARAMARPEHQQRLAGGHAPDEVYRSLTAILEPPRPQAS